MNVTSNKGVLAAFLGTLAIITYREYKSSTASGWSIPYLPPPYKFTWAAVVFGLLALLSDMISPKIATVVAVGVMLGVLMPVLKNPPKGPNTSTGPSGSTPSSGGQPAPFVPGSGNPQTGGTNSPGNPSTSKRFPNG